MLPWKLDLASINCQNPNTERNQTGLLVLNFGSPPLKIYFNSTVTILTKSMFHCPTEVITMLLFVGYVIILCSTQTGLKRNILALATYCYEEMLTISYSKIKVMVFTHRS